jgi:hypothetical protein
MKKSLSLLLATAMILVVPAFASGAVLPTTLQTGTMFPSQNGTTTVSGNCGTSGANSTVSFSINQNGIITNLPSSGNLSTNSTGNFSGNIIFPSTLGSGTATLTATCSATGDVINSSTLTFPAPASTAFSLPGTNPTASGTFNLGGACGNANGAGFAHPGQHPEP